MTSPTHAIATESGRFYTGIPGFEHLSLGSVTNIVNIKNKPAIAPWAAKLAAERAMRHESEWHAIQTEEGDEAARKWISRASKDEMDYKSAIGSAVHLACEVYPEPPDPMMLWGILGGLPGDCDAHLERVMAHVAQLERFVSDYDVRFIEQERTVLNPDDGWAGTLDAVVEIPDEKGALRRYVLDYKTGSVYPDSTCLQLAAYRHATYAVHGNTSKPFTHEIDGGIVVQLKPKSYKVWWLRCDGDVYRRFLAARDLWLWATSEHKGAAGDEWR